MDCKSRACKTLDNLSQSMYSNHSWSVQVPAVDRPHRIEAACCNFWHVREIGKHSYVTPSAVAWSSGLHGSRKNAKAVAVWRSAAEGTQTWSKEWWQDVVRSDLQLIGMTDQWYGVAQNRRR